MPSFLNKVFGYKKNDDKDTARPTREASDSTLLDGKYEAIPPIVSPSASTFTEAQPTKDSGRDVGFSFFIPKSRGTSQKSARKHPEAAPHLTLQLPALKESPDSRALGVVFEADPDSQTILDDAVIAAKQLNPLEALVLIRACAQAITERGLETLGIMHPHWFSASPDTQRKLISLFIRSLAPQSRTTALPPTTASPTSAFEDELHYTRSPHDVAAVLRWGLRHLSLENGHFGKDNTEWAWYNAFFHAERNASYPPKGFSELLLPQLPVAHIELLTATLSLVSSLASHAEVNGISGSKLSKFLGIWLLVATRAEQSDDWNQFYARWEHAGRILEHLFLARLREESFGQRLPTRLQELVKHYPYNNGSLATDGLLSRPRFSTRQYDALFVRVETVLIHSTEQPKQHPVQLLLEAFQLPVENLPEDEHVALWNTLKTTASDQVTSLDPEEGLQFTRIFVDETIQLLSLIPADNSVPTSPTLLASPITKVVSRKRSSSLIKVLERTAPKSNADNGSTPVSPTSPTSPVITDWAQFSLSGFGGTPTTQPLAALLDQDDDIEVTQPRNVRKSSRQRGKSRSTRRRRSEDREPLDTSPTSQSKCDPSIAETKLASVHVIQIDEAFIDFWSDAVVDPISANWPVFVVCGLKQIPGAKTPVRWLVVEQTYNHQQPQSSRVPSPDGHRGRSPRPSFRSDISGFRINSVFSSARKRLSLFSKSATDLDPKKSGGKAPIVGELGEVLVEEEPVFPSVPPIRVGHHFDENAVIGATVTSGAASGVVGQSKTDDIFAAPVGAPPTDPVPMLQESNPVQAAVKEPLIEGAPQSEGGHNDFSVLPRSSVRRSEEAVSVEQGSSRTLDAANPEVNEADPVTNIAPLPADMTDSRSIRDTSDPAVLASSLTPTAENPVSEEVQILAEPFRQGFIVEAEDQLITQPTDGDERLLVESVNESSDVNQVNVADGSQGVSETVALSLVPESVVVVLETLSLDDEAPEHITEEPRVVKQPSRQASTEFVAASTVGSVGQHEMGDLPAVQDKVGATETGAQLEPDSIISVVGAAEEASDAAEPVDTIIPAPGEFAVLVEETCPEVSVDADGRAGIAKDHAAKPEAFDDAVPHPHPVATESQPNSKAEKESAIHHVEGPSVDTNVQAVTIETKHAADLVPEPAAEEVQPFVQATTVQVVEAPVETFPAPEVEAQAAAVSEAHSVEIEDTGTSTSVPENAAFVNETPSPDAAEAYKPVEVAPVVVLESEAVEDEAPELSVEAKALPSDTIPPVEVAQLPTEIELPTQFADTEPAKALSTESISEVAIFLLATTDEIDALKPEAQPTLDTPTEDAEAHTSAPRSAPIEGITMEANEPMKLAPSTIGDFEFVVDNVTEPIIKEAQVLVEDTVLSASEPIAVTPTVIDEEPVAQDVQVPIEIEELSSEFASQSDDEAVNPSFVAVFVPEEISFAMAGAPLEPEATHPIVEEIVKSTEPAPLVPEVGVSVDTETLTDVTEPELVEISVPVPVVDPEPPVPVEVKEPASDAVEVTEESVTSQPEVASAVEIDETGVVNDLQKDINDAEQPAGSELDVFTHEPAGLSEEISPAEP